MTKIGNSKIYPQFPSIQKILMNVTTCAFLLLLTVSFQTYLTVSFQTYFPLISLELKALTKSHLFAFFSILTPADIPDLVIGQQSYSVKNYQPV